MLDLINGLFEIAGAVAVWRNVVKLYKDKQIRGVDWRLWIFFSSWGIWNLYYYPSLDQWFSTIGGAIMVIANLVWVFLAIKYKNN